jgi:hypothetical protein
MIARIEFSFHEFWRGCASNRPANYCPRFYRSTRIQFRTCQSRACTACQVSLVTRTIVCGVIDICAVSRSVLISWSEIADRTWVLSLILFTIYRHIFHWNGLQSVNRFYHFKRIIITANFFFVNLLLIKFYQIYYDLKMKGQRDLNWNLQFVPTWYKFNFSNRYYYFFDQFINFYGRFCTEISLTW